MDKIRWGVLSTAKIGRDHVIPAINRSRRGRVTAIASRDLARGKALADEQRIPTVHGSYEALLADPNVDAIYNPLPNHLHVPWFVLPPGANWEGLDALCTELGLNLLSVPLAGETALPLERPEGP